MGWWQNLGLELQSLGSDLCSVTSGKLLTSLCSHFPYLQNGDDRVHLLSKLSGLNGTMCIKCLEEFLGDNKCSKDGHYS